MEEIRIINVFLPMIVFIMIVLLFSKKYENEAGFKLDLRCTEELKGIAIILVIFGHLSADKIIHAKDLLYVGSQGVTLFLLLSGFGLTKSYIKNGIDKKTVFRRFKRILIPYSMVTTLWVIIDIFVYHKNYSIQTVIMAIAGFDFNRKIDASMWYISFILLWYLFFFIIFLLPMKKIFKIIMLVFVAYLFRFHPVSKYTHEVSYQWGLNAISFPVGAFLGMYMEDIAKKISKKHMNYIYAFVGIMSLVTYVYLFKDRELNINKFTITNLSFAVMIIILVGFVNMKGYRSKLLGFIGFYSYEIYLLEAALMWKYRIIRNLQTTSTWLFLIVYFLSLFVLSYILNKIITFIMESKFINNKKQV